MFVFEQPFILSVTLFLCTQKEEDAARGRAKHLWNPELSASESETKRSESWVDLSLRASVGCVIHHGCHCMLTGPQLLSAHVPHSDRMILLHDLLRESGEYVYSVSNQERGFYSIGGTFGKYSSALTAKASLHRNNGVWFTLKPFSIVTTSKLYSDFWKFISTGHFHATVCWGSSHAK